MPQKQNKEIGYIKPREIIEEMRESYLDYAMSVIISRALPDVRDGLKPVHRRILYAMYEDGLRHTAKFRKSATVVGSCLGRYHPHGDVAVYDALVRMAQDFSLRYPLVQGQGNFGCFTKDTKVRLTDGRNLNFKDLIKEQKKGKRHWTFNFNPETQKIEITEIKNPRLTRKNEEIMEVTLNNGEKIKCTLDHRFMMRNGSYRKAKDLQTGDSLMPAYFNTKQIKDGHHYLAILQPFTGRYEFIDKLADEYHQRNGKTKKSLTSYILHHKDFNRWNNSPDNIERLSWKEHYKIPLNWTKNLWKEKGDEFREKHRESLKQVFSDPVIRKRMSENSKKLWRDPKYRAKYPEDHFSRIAKELSSNPETPKFHREKIRKQWQDPEFREKVLANLVQLRRQRVLERPYDMKQLAQRAAVSLRKKWPDPSDKEKVIKSKILGFVYSLTKKYSKITPEIYEKERYNNCFPTFKNALKYFDNFSEIVEKSQRYNHKVVKTRILERKEDVYDLTTEPWHNFLLAAGIFVHNSVDGDSAASMRYTEARLSAIGEQMLQDIEKETVDFRDNYDGTRKEPIVLPSPLPQLLLNGSLGIAVGMATNIPPHHLSEVLRACVYLVDHPQSTTEDLFEFVQGPDFPTGGQIFGKKDIMTAYSQGKGAILMRGKAEIHELKGGSSQILITEIPFQVQKADLVRSLAKLVEDKKINGVKDIRDESGRQGMRIVISLKRDAFPKKVLNALYKYTDLQKTFYLNMLALVDGIQPKVLSLVDILTWYLKHKQEVILRRTKFDLRRAKERAHILEGLVKALKNIDEVIKTIKKSASRQDAQKNLIKRFKLTKIQAEAILEMKLQNLARLEREKIEKELKEMKEKIKNLTLILKSPKKVKEVMKKELREMAERFGDERRTKVISSRPGEIGEEELIPKEETIITLTRGGYIKRTKPSVYKIQKRGGKGISGGELSQEDIMSHFVVANTLDKLLFFTDSGKVFQCFVWEIPEAGRVARGRGLSNFLEISQGEKTLSLIPYSKEDEAGGKKYLAMVTKNGIIKKTDLAAFKNVRRSGLRAIKLQKDDLLRKAVILEKGDEIILVSQEGKSIKFKEKDLRKMGRAAAGVRGIRLAKGDEVVGMDVIESQKSKVKSQKLAKRYLLVVSENGYGKRTEISEYRLQKRGGSGIKAARINQKTGKVVFSKVVGAEERDLVVISKKGLVIRSALGSISILGRATSGVRVMRLAKEDKVASAICL